MSKRLLFFVLTFTCLFAVTRPVFAAEGSVTGTTGDRPSTFTGARAGSTEQTRPSFSPGPSGTPTGPSAMQQCMQAISQKLRAAGLNQDDPAVRNDATKRAAAVTLYTAEKAKCDAVSLPGNLHSTTSTGTPAGATADQQKKFAAQDQERQKWETFQRQLVKQSSESARRNDPTCAAPDETLSKQLGTVNRNYIGAAYSYKEASQRAHTTVQMARQFLGDEAATAEAMMKLFDEKIALFESQATTFQSQTQATQQFACKPAQGRFSTELGRLKQTGTMNAKSTQDIMSYYEKTLRPELVRLGEKLKAANVPLPSARPEVKTGAGRPASPSTQQLRK